MKKFFVYAALAFSAMACNPMEEIYSELEQQPEEPQFVKTEIEYTISDEDYAELGVDYFNDTLLAENAIPELLAAKYYALEAGSMVSVTYDKYESNNLDFSGVEYSDFVIGQEFKNATSYTLTDDDYASVDKGRFDNFDSNDSEAEIDSMINIILKNQFSSPAQGETVVVFHDYFNYDGYVNSYDVPRVYDYDASASVWNFVTADISGFEKVDVYLEDEHRMRYAFNEGFAYELIDVDYNLFPVFANSNYKNFTGSNKPEDYLPSLLSAKLPLAVAGDEFVVTYEYYNGDGTEDITAKLAFDGDVWTMVEAGQVVTMTEPFEFTGEQWEVVRATFYTLTEADYDMIGEFDESSELNIASIADYHNFGYYLDVEGTYNGEAVDNVIDALLTDFMSQKFVDAEEGDQYIITFAVYGNQYDSNEQQIKFEKTANGFEILENSMEQFR